MIALIELSGSNLVPSFYLIVTALLSLAVLAIIRTSLRLRTAAAASASIAGRSRGWRGNFAVMNAERREGRFRRYVHSL
jgi:hypothetical protein